MKNYFNLNQLSMNWKEKRKTGDNSMKPADDQQMTSRRPAEKPVQFFRYVAMLLMLLTLGVGQMWAGYQEGKWGFWADGGLVLTWSKNGNSATTTINHGAIASGGSLGTITTSLNLTNTQVNFWRTEHYGNVCSATVYWKLYKGSTKVDEGDYSPATWGSWSGSNGSLSYSTSQNFLDKTTGPGDYTLRVYAELKGAGSNDYYDDASYKGCGTSCWYNKDNSTYYEITFTIPSKNLTVAGAGDGNTVSGSVTGITKGTAYTITATPTAGYAFNGWTKTSGGTSITIADASSATTTVTFNNYSNNATVTASFVEEETHDITVSYVNNNSQTIKNSTTESAVGVSTTRSVTAPAINDHTWASWTVGTGVKNNSANTTTNPISINSKASGSYTLQANYNLIPCSIVYKFGSGNEVFNRGGTSVTTTAMSYDVASNAYYIDVATSGTQLNFRFYYNNSKEYATAWNGSYPGVYSVDINGTQRNCTTEVQGWDNKSSIKVTYASGTTSLRVWYSKQTGKAWVTETTYSVSIASENTNRGTVNKSSVTAGRNTASASFTATPVSNSGWMFKQWSATSPASLVSSATTNPNTVKATSTGGSVQAQFKHRYILRGSTDADNNVLGGMAGWDATDNSAYASATISDGVMTITANLTKAKTKYKFKIYDLSGSSWKGQTVTTDIPDNTARTLSGSNNVTLTTTAAGTYTFVYTVSSNSIKVLFPSPVYSVTYGVQSGTGTVTAKIGTESIGATPGKAVGGSNVVMTATAGTGYQFSKWVNESGTQISTSNPYTISSIAANCTIKAVFTARNYTTANNLKEADGTANGQYNVTYDNTSIAHTSAPSRTGYTVEGYYKQAAWTNKIANTNLSLVASTDYATSASKWKVTSAPDLYIKWQQTLTLAGNGAGSTNGSVTTTYLGTASSHTAATRTGYTLKGYYDNTSGGNKILTNAGALVSYSASVSSYINSTGKWIYNGTPTLSAQWTVNTYTIMLDKGTGGTANGTATVDYDASELKTKTDATKTGHTLTGYYTAASSGTKVLNADGSFAGSNIDGYITSGKWSKAADCTLYAQWTPNNYTVTFDATTNGGSCATASKSVTYGSTYGELPVATHAANTFIGWYTTASGVGSRVTSSTTVSTASNHTLYARFESTYTINVQYKCGSVTLYPGTTVQASATSLAADISAPEVLGYSFVNWTGSNATFGNASSATTTVNATAATTITANYNAVPTVYFKNNLGWDSVYVTFDAYFNGTGNYDDAPGNKTKPYYKMNRLGTSDIYYYEIPSTYTASNYASWANGIAFNNINFNKKATSTHVGDMQAFNGGEFTARMDFDPKATMYIPYKGDTDRRNGGTYYRTGCWMKYNSTESGYQVKVNTYVNGAHADTLYVYLTADIAGGFEFKAKVNLKHPNYTYGFKLYKDKQKNPSTLYYSNGGTIQSNTTTLPWPFYTKVDNADVTADSKRCGVHTEALGDYEFTVSFATGKPMVDVIYPVSVGDWRLVYKDLATWSNSAHSASWYHPSRVIKAKANAVDTVSFFVAYGSTPSVELQKCTAIDGGTGAQTWTKQSDLSLSSITKKGVYNFRVTQNGSKVATAAYLGEYSGDFYIRTDASDGGWNNYMNGANTMTYSEYSIEHGGYTHYFMSYRNSGTSVKFVIANDYSLCISDTILGDTYTNSSEWLPAAANVRFMWDKRSNTISRAYLSGSTIVSDRFLVLEGDAKMFDENGNALSISGLNANEMKFTDDQNWIYEATVKAQPTARIKLTAKYNNKVQYFYGAAGTRTDANTELLIGGSGTDKYKVRVVYDFKTNRLIKAFIPEGTISTAMAISADLMIIREAQGDAQQINFSGDGTLSKVQTVYGAMKFNKWTVNDKEKTSGHANLGWSRYKRDLFYISFPFDVKLSDAFGFGEYGKHWIIEYYDGKGRAANGFWADSDPNWKFVWPSQRSSFTLKAFEGYILALELEEMTESSEVWEHGVEDVYVYFPSADSVKNISATTRTITIDQEGYYCSINRPTPDGDRRVKDSYWHVIGVPSFANYSSTLYDTNGGTAIDWRSTSMPYLYEWNSSDNTLSITTSANFAFKPTYSYMVQYAGASIYWNAVNVTPAAAPRRNPAYRGEYEFRMELLQNDEKVDQTYVKLSDNEHVTTGFEFNYDLSKEFNKKKANLYTLIGTEQVAGNVLPLTEQTTIIPVGVKTVASGDYTFAMPDGTEGVGVTLIDNETGERTNLGLTDYTVTLEAGTYDERFALEISPIKQTPTDIELLNGENGEDGVRKVMIDGILYIVKDGKVFDARGHRVK